MRPLVVKGPSVLINYIYLDKCQVLSNFSISSFSPFFVSYTVIILLSASLINIKVKVFDLRQYFIMREIIIAILRRYDQVRMLRRSVAEAANLT